MTQIFFGIILPTYHEEDNIKSLLWNIAKSITYEKIVVVDDSRDNKTQEACMDFIANNPSLKDKIILKHRKNESGRSSAVLAGMKILHGLNMDYIIEMDCDFSHPPSQLSQLKEIALFQKNIDCVICSRDIKGSKIVGWPFRRHILHFCACFSARLILRLGIRDYLNAYRMFSYRAIELILRDSTSLTKGFWGFGETLVNMRINNFNILEIPTTFVNRIKGDSKVNTKIIFSCAVELVRVFFLLHKKRKIFKNIRRNNH